MLQLDPRDVFYSIVGLSLLLLTLQPALARYRLLNLPLLFVAIGAGLGIAGAPMLDPRGGGLIALVIEHSAELIVIISLSGAGLAIDTPFGWKRWQPTIRLLAIAMPLTMLGVALAGSWITGLSVAGAVLLAAAMAPTDPVLARSVQVGPPGKTESPVELALTAEAGLNDGLAFPFIYLAITLAAVAAQGGGAWFVDWLGYDVLYRIAVGVAVGYATGAIISRLAMSRYGDAHQGAWNSIVMILGATMVSYGVTEAVDGYGFLAVFFATRAGRANTRGTENEGYEKYVHHGADQLESILLVLLLIWFGSFVAGGGLAGLRAGEVAVAVLLLFVIRPLAGWIAMLGYRCERVEAHKIAFFGIRGMGSVFYIAYAQNHGQFADIDSIWRIAAVTILGSIVVHGFAANFMLPGEEDDEVHPYRADDPEITTEAPREKISGE
ncbi:cation:proton antiporter [Roseobacter sp. HKCCA0434]|uniref:cation:proton antiporter n=1 Tax=Roseobacter sp. HKCCA0434 TaxID=3079297 RepID=UPI002905E2AE|nr:cation:proton antiporter [Roseobacter sp. HKCCA0434]